MNIESLRRCCLSLPHATEHVQWGDTLVFKVGGKMFAIASVDPDAPRKLSLKTEPQTMAALLEQPRIVPAPYLARCHWVALEAFDALSDHELKQHIEAGHRAVLDSLPKTRLALEAGPRDRVPARGSQRTRSTRSESRKAARLEPTGRKPTEVRLKPDPTEEGLKPAQVRPKPDPTNKSRARARSRPAAGKKSGRRSRGR